MKLSCLLFRQWLIPYANGTLQTERPALAARIDRHLDDCSPCSTEAARLESNDSVLRGYAARSRGRDRHDDIQVGSRSRPMTPLSSRVLASIQSDERLHSSNRWSPNGLSFATAALGVAVFVSVINPQSGVFGMIRNFLAPHQPKVTRSAPPTFPVYAPLPPHDPMGLPHSGGVTPAATSDSDESIQQSSATHGELNGHTTPRIVRQETTLPVALQTKSTQQSVPAPITTGYDTTTMQSVGDQQSGDSQTSMTPPAAPALPATNVYTTDTHSSGSLLENYVTTGPSVGYNGLKDTHVEGDPEPPKPPWDPGQSREQTNLMTRGPGPTANPKPTPQVCPPPAAAPAPASPQEAK